MDRVSTEVRSRNMAAVRSKGNRSTELALGRLLFASGLRGYRKHWAVDGRPDFAWPGLRVAVFVDGCFWHGALAAKTCPKATLGSGATKSGLISAGTSGSRRDYGAPDGPWFASRNVRCTGRLRSIGLPVRWRVPAKNEGRPPLTSLPAHLGHFPRPNAQQLLVAGRDQYRVESMGYTFGPLRAMSDEDQGFRFLFRLRWNKRWLAGSRNGDRLRPRR